MKTITTMMLLVLSLVTSARADVAVQVTKATSVSGLNNPTKIGDLTIVDADSKPILSEIAVIKVDSSAQFVRVRARKSMFESMPLTKVDGVYLLSLPGKYLIEVSTFDPNSGMDEGYATVELGGITPTPPDPTPTPVPVPPTPGPVGPDEFNNIGQRVASWAVGLPKQAQVSACYVRAATRLLEDPLATVNTVSADLVSCRTSLLGNDASLYIALTDRLNIDLKSRWPMSKGVLADYFNAIAKGLK